MSRSDLETMAWAHWVLLNDGAGDAPEWTGKPGVLAALAERLEAGGYYQECPGGRWYPRAKFKKPDKPVWPEEKK